MSFQNIFRLLAQFVGKYAVVEFIPGQDAFLQAHYGRTERFKGYNEKGFESALQHVFRVVETAPSFPEGRRLWLLEKKLPG